MELKRESESEFINESILNYIPPKYIKRFLNWHSQGLKHVKDLLKLNFATLKGHMKLNGHYLL